MVLPAAMVDCCLASLRAGICSPPWRWRFSALVLMVACSSSPSGEEVGSISYTLAYSRLDFGFV